MFSHHMESKMQKNPILEHIKKLSSHQEITTINLANLAKQDYSKKIWKLFVESLAKVDSVINLSISNSNIDEFILEDIVEIFKNPHCTVGSFNLSKNPLSDRGASILIASLANNNSITNLNLSETGISDESIDLLIMLIKNHKKMMAINLHGNPISQKNIEIINKELYNNLYICDDDKGKNSNNIKINKSELLLSQLISEVMQAKKNESLKKNYTKVIIAYFKTQPNLYFFYLRLYVRLSSLFHACYVATSTFYIPDKSNTSTKVAYGLEALAICLSFIPVIGTALNRVTSTAKDGLHMADLKRQCERLANIAKSGGFVTKDSKNGDQLALQIAIELTIRYQNQLIDLPKEILPKTKVINAVDKLFIASDEEDRLAFRLAELAFSHIVQVGIQENEINIHKSLAEEIIRVFNEPFNWLEEAFNQVGAIGRTNVIYTLSGRIWEFNKILTAPAYVSLLNSNKIYITKSTDISYGVQYVQECWLSSLNFHELTDPLNENDEKNPALILTNKINELFSNIRHPELSTSTLIPQQEISNVMTEMKNMQQQIDHLQEENDQLKQNFFTLQHQLGTLCHDREKVDHVDNKEVIPRF